MAKASYIFHIIFRVLLGFSLIALAGKYYVDLDANHGFVSQNLRLYAEKFGMKWLLELRKYSELIVFTIAACLAYTGLFEVYGFEIAKYLAGITAVLDLLLIHNPYFYQEPKLISLALLNFGLFGAVLNN